MPEIKRRRKFKGRTLKPAPKTSFVHSARVCHLTSPDKIRMFLSKATNQCHKGLIEPAVLKACAYACQTLMSVFKYNRERYLEERIAEIEEKIIEALNKNERPVSPRQVRRLFAVEGGVKPRKIPHNTSEDERISAVATSGTRQETQTEIETPAENSRAQEAPAPKLRRSANGNVIRIRR